MFAKYSALALIMASMAIGAPLNINLGAYSPALVVGDGEISFAGAGGEAGAANIVNTLQGAAASGGNAVAQGAAIAPAAPTTAAAATTGGNALQRAAILNEPASLPVPGLNKRNVDAAADEVDEVVDVVEKREEKEEGGLTKRQSSGFDRALTFAEAALTKGPKVELGTPQSGVGILVTNTPAAAGAAKAA